MTNSDLIRYAASHGFDAHQDDASDGIVVWVPWVNVNTDEDGEDKFVCRNIREVRDALGY